MQTAQVYTKTALVNNVINERLRLKYRLKEFFIAFCGCEEAVRRAKQYLLSNYDIPASTLKHDLNIRAAEDAIIPPSRLNKYAAYFGISSQELYTDCKQFN